MNPKPCQKIWSLETVGSQCTSQVTQIYSNPAVCYLKEHILISSWVFLFVCFGFFTLMYWKFFTSGKRLYGREERGRRWNGKKEIHLGWVRGSSRNIFHASFHTKPMVMRTCYMPGTGWGVRGTVLDRHQRDSKETQQLGRHTDLKTHLHRLESACRLLGRLWHGQKKTSKTLQTSNPFQGCNQQDRKWENHPRRDLEGKGLIQGRLWPCAWAVAMCTFKRRDTVNSLAPRQ